MSRDQEYARDATDRVPATPLRPPPPPPEYDALSSPRLDHEHETIATEPLSPIASTLRPVGEATQPLSQPRFTQLKITSFDGGSDSHSHAQEDTARPPSDAADGAAFPRNGNGNDNDNGEAQRMLQEYDQVE
ncbi:hypothetical protein KEM52_004281, partial [Ascosphaera acerosa]